MGNLVLTMFKYTYSTYKFNLNLEFILLNLMSTTIILTFTGNSYHDLQYLYRVARNTVSQIVPETCAAIYDALCLTYVKVCDIVFTNWYMLALEMIQNCFLANFEDHVMMLDH